MTTTPAAAPARVERRTLRRYEIGRVSTSGAHRFRVLMPGGAEIVDLTGSGSTLFVYAAVQDWKELRPVEFAAVTIPSTFEVQAEAEHWYCIGVTAVAAFVVGLYLVQSAAPMEGATMEGTSEPRA